MAKYTPDKLALLQDLEETLPDSAGKNVLSDVIEDWGRISVAVRMLEASKAEPRKRTVRRRMVKRSESMGISSSRGR